MWCRLARVLTLVSFLSSLPFGYLHSWQVPIDSDDSDNDSKGSDDEERKGDDLAIMRVNEDDEAMHQRLDEDDLHSDEALAGDLDQSDDSSQFEDTMESLDPSSDPENSQSNT